MGLSRRYILTLFLSFLTAGAAFAQEPVYLTRQDRHQVPIRVYAPQQGACQGIAIISPGAGGSEDGYAYLGEAMAAQGYLAAVVGHRESGREALRRHLRARGFRQGLLDLITDPGAYRGRFMDIAAARKWAQARCRGSQSVLIGHSMGAATVMMAAGAKNRLGVTGEDAFDAYVALSPQGVGSIFPENAWSGIAKPVLILTGTRDRELESGSWQTRTEPFRSLPPGCKWLGIIDGARHLNFAGRGFSRRTEALTIRTIRAFLRGVWRGDCALPPDEEGVEMEGK